MKMKMEYNGIICDVETSPKLNVGIGELCPDAVSYAVCRLFAKTPSLCREYAMESCRMRFASGRGRKSRKCKCVLPAILAQIDAELLEIEFCVNGTGVLITAVRTARFPKDQEE